LRLDLSIPAADFVCPRHRVPACARPDRSTSSFHRVAVARASRALRGIAWRSAPMTSDRQESETGRPESSCGDRKEKPWEQDPFYQGLTRDRRRANRARRKDFINARVRRRRATEADFRDRERARRYGLSLEELRAMLARQGNACAICRKAGVGLHIDHCHATGKVRGLLCRKCNQGLGNYNDDPSLTAAATAYLKAARGA
jgi:recombination endonuclease VII